MTKSRSLRRLQHTITKYYVVAIKTDKHLHLTTESHHCALHSLAEFIAYIIFHHVNDIGRLLSIVVFCNRVWGSHGYVITAHHSLYTVSKSLLRLQAYRAFCDMIDPRQQSSSYRSNDRQHDHHI